MAQHEPDRGRDLPPDRRTFVASAASLAMAGGLVASYGTFALMAGRFLYPARPTATAWRYVADVASFRPGASLSFKTPGGASVAIARQGSAGLASDFIALSSTCPHLGCQVHWEAQNNRFFCPCHNGTFDPSGKAPGGPPGEAGQSLLRYPVKVDGGLLYILVPTTIVAGRQAGAPGQC
ncbi:MAG: ubiquinol-cytochrome c reductase iron-sulfur subunit [Planctomycetota bacterium]